MNVCTLIYGILLVILTKCVLQRFLCVVDLRGGNCEKVKEN